MTWHLKDRELEKKLEVFSGGNFVNSMNREIERDNIDSEFFVWVAFGRKLSGDDDKDNCLLFRMDEIEEVAEYNPKDWNNFPEVTPPEGVYMRVEFEDKSGGKAVFYQNEWLDTDCTLFSFSPVKFRPWED